MPKLKKKRPYTAFDGVLLASFSVLGFISFTYPLYLEMDTAVFDLDFFSAVKMPIELAYYPSIMLILFVTGFLLGYLRGCHWLALGLSPVLLFPFFMFMELIFVDPGSHNLFPFELLGYLVLASPSLLSSFLGVRLKSWLEEKGEQSLNLKF